MTRDDVYHLARHLFGGPGGGGWTHGAAAATGYDERWWRRVVAGDTDLPDNVARYLELRAALEGLLPRRHGPLERALASVSENTRRRILEARESLTSGPGGEHAH